MMCLGKIFKYMSMYTCMGERFILWAFCGLININDENVVYLHTILWHT